MTDSSRDEKIVLPEEEWFFKENKPPCKIIRTNEPNMELMAKAFRELYYETRDIKDNNKNDK